MIEINQHFCYLRPMRIPVFTLVMLLFWSCSKLPESSEPEDPIQELQFEFLQFANQLYFSALVQPTYLNNSLDSVLVLWYGSDSLASPDTIRLNDSGKGGDIIAHDDIFSIKILNINSDSLMNSMPVSIKGYVYIDLGAYYFPDVITVSDSFHIGNLPPRIVNVIIADSDTITVPSEEKLIQCEVDDENGLIDINFAGFKTYHVQLDSFMYQGNYIELFDDGSEENIPIYDDISGDEEKGDGIYSMTIRIPSTAEKGDYHWIFTAKDFSNEESEPWIHEIHIK